MSREGLALRATLSERARGLRKGVLHRMDLDGMERLDMAGYGWTWVHCGEFRMSGQLN